MKKLIIGGLAALAITLGAAPTANAAPWPDESYFLRRLYENNISNVYGEQQSLYNGYVVCQRYRQGWSNYAVIQEVAAYNPALIPGDKHITFVVLAQWALCPDMLPPDYRDDAIDAAIDRSRPPLVRAQ